jgi:hypothetical protein
VFEDRVYGGVVTTAKAKSKDNLCKNPKSLR